MRTALFFGLICIAESIGKQTGWATQTSLPESLVIAMLIFIISADIIDFFKEIK